jgi:WD40 repeat protein
VVTLQGHSRPVVSAQFSADGRWIVTASEDRTARVWDAATGAEVLGLRGHSQALLSAAFSPDSRRVVTVSTDGTVRLWRADPERVYGLPLKGHHKPLTAVAFSRDGRRLVTASEDRTARIWDAATGNQLAVLSAGEGIKPLAAREHLFGTVRQAMFSPDGRRVLTVAADPQACLTLNLFRPKESRIPVPFAPARLWDAVTSKEVLGLQWRTAAGNDHPNFPGMGQKNGLEAGRFSADGKRVLTIEDGDVRLVAVGAVHGGPEMAMHSFGNERTVRVWDAATGKELAALKGHDPGSLGADISPDGRHVVTGSRLWRSAEVAIRLWDVAGGKERFRLKQEGVCPYPLFSTDGQRILGFQRDRLHIWDLKGNVVGRFDATANQPGRPDAAVTFAALSEDGRRAVAVCGDEARVWDVTAGKALALLTGHEQTIRTAQFSPDGRLVVTASDDETARIWDAATGTERFTLSGHKGAVVCACFSPDGKTVATASADGTARLWPIDPLAIARARTPREFTALERRRFEIDR